MSAAPLVEVRGLRKVFAGRTGLAGRLAGRPAPGIVAVDGVSFDVAKGRTFALVGESGSGKSTIAQMVVGLLAPTAGTVRIDGIGLDESGAARQALRRRIQMVFQDPYTSLNPRWRVDAIVAEPFKALGIRIGRREAEERVAQLLVKVGLHPADARKFPHEFSGGQRQRVAIARALAADADFVVCDEPTSALDVSVQAQILNLMRDLQDELGLTYLFISHNLSVVRYMADDVAVLKAGRIVAHGPASRVLDEPEDGYTRELLAAVPDPAALAAAGDAEEDHAAGEGPEEARFLPLENRRSP